MLTRASSKKNIAWARQAKLQLSSEQGAHAVWHACCVCVNHVLTRASSRKNIAWGRQAKL
eukprot:1146967-Pelagomonas_calceolata.AAC.6